MSNQETNIKDHILEMTEPENVVGRQREANEDADGERMKLGDLNANWTEDFPEENGNYQNSCAMCGEMFLGHKRRVVCRICATLDAGDLPSLRNLLREVIMDRDTYYAIAAHDSRAIDAVCDELRLDRDNFIASICVLRGAIASALEDARGIREILEQRRDAQNTNIESKDAARIEDLAVGIVKALRGKAHEQ